MKAIGLTCGIGSMLVGARAAGFDVLGNIEWRKYYHATDANGMNTFLNNFPGASFLHNDERMTESEFARFANPDLAMGHPECGNFSQLNNSNATARAKVNDPADIPLFTALVAKFRPRFFVMDDLPKSFIAYPMAEYAKALPDYDLFPEWVHNWGYGNIQLNRKRMFMIGSLKSERWAFRANEASHDGTVESTIGDIITPRVRGNVANHEPHAGGKLSGKAHHLRHRDDRPTWNEVREWFKDKRGGKVIEYVSDDGSIKTRPGTYKGHWDAHAHVMDGGSPAIHHLRCEPYTIRERARIQGFPDDFIFYGTKLEPDGSWCHDANIHMVKQTGKAMPIQFCTYVADQVARHIGGRPPLAGASNRLLDPNIYVDEAKRWYCTSIGYADQRRACGECWLYESCSIRHDRYGIGERRYKSSDFVDIDSERQEARSEASASDDPTTAGRSSPASGEGTRGSVPERAERNAEESPSPSPPHDTHTGVSEPIPGIANSVRRPDAGGKRAKARSRVRSRFLDYQGEARIMNFGGDDGKDR